jgi:hypothetical protein
MTVRQTKKKKSSLRRAGGFLRRLTHPHPKRASSWPVSVQSPPMPRRLFTVLSALSLVLCLALVVAWVRSYAVETILLESRPGQLLLIGVDDVPETVHKNREGQSIEDFLAGLSHWNPPQEQRLLGFYLARGGSGTRVVGPGNSYTLQYFWVLGVPYWPLVLLTLIAPAWWMWRRRTALRRARANACANCGYDLRATPGRCPECGSVAAKA